ncbi:S41 family peptidase [Paenibacillus sp. NPDC057967]|uniref:S41 family peptidase n=1 Tax=Paenibacillus sp. NPDC057967 TaxID=3346293 RepID=UPI0036DA9A96
MYFKGRTVFAFVMVTIIASVLVTMTLADQWIRHGDQRPASAVAAAAAADEQGRYQLSADELAKLNAVLELIESKYYEDVEREELLDGAVSGMMKALDDPYSVYMEKEVAQHFSESIEGSFTGIGAEVTTEDGKIIVVSPIKGSPAERSGLLAKDVLISVNGVSLNGLNLQEAVTKIRGPKGTKAKIVVQRSGFSEPIQLVLIRDDIDVETVHGTMRPDGIGVIEIRQFSLNTAKRFKDELEKLEGEGMKGLVLDVRNNPGGVLPIVVEISQLMMKEGSTVVQVEYRDGKREKTQAKGGSQKDYPIAVLTNKGSASASEILAGALQEAAGATVIGEQSFGKGTVQVSYNKALGDGSLLKMTIAKWLTPDGNWIHKKGITPNQIVEPPDMYTVARMNVLEPLKADSLSEQVRSAQIMLHGLGFDPSREDGYFDEETVEAVKKFQTQHQLPVTGEIDAKTAALLEQAVVKWIQNKDNDVQLLEAVKSVSRK